MEGRSLFLRHRPHSSHAFRITLCERKFLSFRSEKTGKFEGWERSLEPASSRPQDLRSPRPTSFQIIPSLPASNYKRQLYVPSLQWIMPLILENTGGGTNVDGEKRTSVGRALVKEEERRFLGCSPRRNRALAAGGYFRMQTDFEFTGRGKKFHGCTAERHSNLPARSPRPSFCFLSLPKKKEILFRLLSSCRCRELLVCASPLA